jgi:hypothetical protein
LWSVLAFAAITVVSFQSSLTWTRVFVRVAGGFLFPLLAMSGLLAMKVFSGLRAFVSLLRLHYRNARQRRLSRRIAVQWRPSVSLTI